MTEEFFKFPLDSKLNNSNSTSIHFCAPSCSADSRVKIVGGIIRELSKNNYSRISRNEKNITKKLTKTLIWFYILK